MTAGDQFDRVSFDAEMMVDDFTKISHKRLKSVQRKLLQGAPYEPLRGELSGLRRITSGSFRAIYEPREWKGQRIAHVLEIGPRSSVYDASTINARRRA